MKKGDRRYNVVVEKKDGSEETLFRNLDWNNASYAGKTLAKGGKKVRYEVSPADESR